ncbi:flavoprotein [Streptacidiphilus melanogenes]|uniref:flavoprotein n=1 Tax=Streptacidiphilus melanogenes TaxID=411235 RepID=UPI000A067918|nr:flavoprotein [Streptacidiphilus melanogenes]
MGEFAAGMGPPFVERARQEGLTVVIGAGSVAAANLGGLAYELGRAQPGPLVVILTEAAERFVTPTAVRHLGQCPVLGEETTAQSLEPLHVWLTDVASRLLVYPASAGFLARTAAGMATDLASTTLLCATGIPTLMVPSMHPRMWANGLVQQNVQRLREAGISVLGSPNGMAPPVEAVVSALSGLSTGPEIQSGRQGHDHDGRERDQRHPDHRLRAGEHSR